LVSVEGKTKTASFALISRVRNYGGDLEIARRASLLRDDFEVVLFRGTHAFQYLPYFVGVALGRIDQMKGVSVLHGQSVLCHGKPEENIFVQVDGELAGRLPIQTKISPDALTLLAPPQYLVRERAFAAVRVCA
jgi:diacylglycerol kinase family enzyme